MGQKQTPRARLASLLIGRPVLTVIEELRADGRSWPFIAAHIRDATDGEIDVTWQAVQQWARLARTDEALDNTA